MQQPSDRSTSGPHLLARFAAAAWVALATSVLPIVLDPVGNPVSWIYALTLYGTLALLGAYTLLVPLSVAIDHVLSRLRRSNLAIAAHALLGVVVSAAAAAALQGSPLVVAAVALGVGGLAGAFRGLADPLQSRPEIAGLSAVGVPLALAASTTLFRLAS